MIKIENEIAEFKGNPDEYAMEAGAIIDEIIRNHKDADPDFEDRAAKLFLVSIILAGIPEVPESEELFQKLDEGMLPMIDELYGAVNYIRRFVTDQVKDWRRQQDAKD